MRVAQLSDLHLLEPGFSARSFGSQWRARFLSIGRPLDAKARRTRFVDALKAAVQRGFDHLLVSGDLTEEGEPEQFEVAAEALAEAKIASDRVTLLAGNHDIYARSDGWKRALAGPLAAAAQASRFGEPIDTRGVTFIPVDTTRAQHYVLSAGELDHAQWDKVRALVADRTKKGRAVVLFMHHPPRRHVFSPMQWIDGLRNAHLVHTLLKDFPNVHVIHGHTHRAVQEIWPGNARARVFSSESVVESKDPLRVYNVDDSGVSIAALPARRVPAFATA
ncbi:MAG: metallophosphoesterase [Deltaproteobacteria bacterium]|nr:metallophosphoesterase [Deltaproteobacteria bacterium]